MLAVKQRRGRLVSARQEIAEQTRLRNNFERSLFRALVRAFTKIGKRAAQQYIDGGRGAVESTPIYDDLSNAMNPIIRQTMLVMAERFQTVRQKQSQFDTMINSYIQNVAGTRLLIARTTFDQIMREIERGVEAGDNPEAIGRRITERTGGAVGRARASTIARTESHSAAGFANNQVARSLNTPLKKRWVSTNDDRTRSAHRKLNGQEVDMDDKFTIEIDGVEYRMDYAGDPAGGAVNTINCRCVIVYVEPEDVIYDDDTGASVDEPVVIERATIENFKITPVSSIAFKSAADARRRVETYVEEGDSDPRQLGLRRFSGNKTFGEVDRSIDSDIIIALEPILDDLDKLSEVFNVPKLRAVDLYDGRRNFTAAMGDATLLVNNKSLLKKLGNKDSWKLERPANQWTRPSLNTWALDEVMSRPWVSSEFFSTSFEGFRSTVLHEFAHHVHQMYKINKLEIEDRIERRDYRFNTPIEKRVKYTRGRKGATQYSDADGQEWFAENFALYFGGRTELVDPKFIDIIEDMARTAYD